MTSGTHTYRLAPMSTDIGVLSALLLSIPIGMIVAVLAGFYLLLGPMVLITAIYAWVWLLFRPSAFIIHQFHVEVVWPLKRRRIDRSSITSCRIVATPELKGEVGWGVRVGAGGLWGGFGWLWTTRRGIVQMYISRTDAFVWIERGSDRPWLITPENPEQFANELAVGMSLLVQTNRVGQTDHFR